MKNLWQTNNNRIRLWLQKKKLWLEFEIQGFREVRDWKRKNK